jgi:hypothetical protein
VHLEPTSYDQSLAEALDDGDESAGLRERLEAGTATDEDRADARGRLDETTRRRFELAHPIPPQAQDLEVEAEELECAIDDLAGSKSWKPHGEAVRERLRAAIEDVPDEQPTVVTVRIRLVPGE